MCWWEREGYVAEDMLSGNSQILVSGNRQTDNSQVHKAV